MLPAGEQKAEAVSDGAGVLEDDGRSRGEVIDPGGGHETDELTTSHGQWSEHLSVDVHQTGRLQRHLSATAARRQRDEHQLKRVDDDVGRVPGDDVSTARDRGAPDHKASAADTQ